MKELTLKYKAQRYDEAIKVANSKVKNDKNHVLYEDDIIEIFPELKENEDERIRKELLEHCKNQAKPYILTGNKYPQIQSWIDWLEKQEQTFTKEDVDDTYLKGVCDAKQELEKQGEQKPILDFKASNWYVSKVDGKIHDMTYNPADKVEPKFREGDWLCENEPNNYARFIQILETVNVQGKERHRISRDIHNDEDIVEFDFVEKHYHKFDIKDAKDGDMLAVEAIEEYYQYPFVAIYKERGLDFFNSYCFIGFDGKFYKGEDGHAIEGIHPATKEQCDLLFQKIKEKGYEWDAEKKELKKIEQKPAWSEEDIKHFRRCLGYIEAYVEPRRDDVRWFKSLKNRVGCEVNCTTTREWSEEDKNLINSIIKDFETIAKGDLAKDCPQRTKNYIPWLKSIKDRVQPVLVNRTITLK